MIFVDGFAIDVAVTEGHEFNSTATRYPVEVGADITDHVRLDPIEISIEGIVSDSPLADVALIRANDGDFVPGAGMGLLPSDDAFARLLEIRSKRQPVTVETSLGIFESMLLEKLSIPRDKDTGFALKFTGSFVQAQFLANKRTQIKVATPRSHAKAAYRNIPTNLTDSRGRAIFTHGLDGKYYYADGKPVPASEINKSVKDSGAVRIKYVNGKAVPVHAEDYQPYTGKEVQPWYGAEPGPAPVVKSGRSYANGVPYE